jgi:arylsulfatase A-like enzyme
VGVAVNGAGPIRLGCARSISRGSLFHWLAILALALPACQPGGSSSRRPDVVLIVIDTLRADHASSYGHARRTTPNIDALAEIGVRYTQAFSHAPWTTPSIASLLASRYPSQMGISNPRSAIPEDVTLLPEVLRNAGYATGGVVSHSLCASGRGFGQGFDFFDESNVLGHDGISSPGVATRAIEFIDAHAREPIFLFLHFFDPHHRYLTHADLTFEEAGSRYRGFVRSGIEPKQLSGRRGLTDADITEVKRIYDSEIAFTDHHIGRVLEHLRARGRFEQALIVVTADHGEEFLDHGGFSHTRTLFNELLRVPLIIKYPDGRTGTVDEPVGLIDVYPTIREQLGIRPDVALRGRSLRAATDSTPRPIYAEVSYKRNLRAVVVGRHKLIHDAERDLYAFFDLRDDPRERANLSGEQPARAAELARLLAGWQEQNRGDPAHAVEVEVGEAERRRLRALGYLD